MFSILNLGSTTQASDKIVTTKPSIGISLDRGDGVVQDITTNQATVVVGQHISLRATSSNATAFAWQIGGDTIKNQNYTIGTGSNTLLSNTDLQANTVSFAWANGSNDSAIPIVLTTTIDGQVIQHPITIKVLRPTATLNATTTKNIPSVDVGSNGIQPYDSLHFGTKASEGIVLKGVVDVTATKIGGEIALINLAAAADREVESATGAAHGLNTNGDYVIDPDYEDKVYTYDPSKKIPSGKVTVGFDDNPNDKLADGFSAVNDDEKFRTYLMFKPDSPNSNWVSLRVVDWFWNGSAAHLSTGWKLLDGNASRNPTSHDSFATPFLDFGTPQWSRDIGSLQGT